MATEFDIQAAKANEILNRLSDSLEVPAVTAYRILQAVLHTIRDHIDIEASLHLLDQLPVAIKGIYADGWSQSNIEHLGHLTDFFRKVRSDNASLPGFNITSNIVAAIVTAKVFKVLNEYMTEEQFENFLSELPSILKEFATDSINETMNQK